jgi:glycosyltransferase involved in cell wall biosynthesis
LTSALTAAGAEVVRCPSPVLRKRALRPRGLVALIWTTIASVIPTVRVLRSVRPDVVYVSTLTLPLWLVLARVSRRPVVCHVHEAEAGLSRPLQRLLIAPLLASSAIVANSRFSLEVVTRAFARLRNRSRVVTNAVAGPDEVEAARRELTKPVELLFLGRLSERKGAHIALEAAHLLIRRGVEVRLTLLGGVFPGYEWFEQRLRETVATNRLEHAVVFRGFEPDVWPLIAGSDIVLVPSLIDEPFGNTAVEAVLAARPVVTTTSGGLPEAVEGFKSAQSVAPGDAAALADAVERIIDGWAAYRDAALDDATRAAERHSVERYGEQIERVVAPLADG